MDERYFDSCYSLDHIFVDDENENYSSDDGVLFNKDRTVLYRYPHDYSEKEYRIPEGTVQVAPYAFDESKVTSIHIPSTVEFFTAVEYCSFLESYSVSDENLEFSSVEDVLFDKDTESLIQYPQAKRGAVYNYDDDDKDYYYYEAPSTLKTINSWAFDSCFYLNKIVLPSSLEYIFDIAFNNIQGSFKLKEVVFNENSNLKEIGDSAFMECSDLEVFEITAIEPPKLEQGVFSAAGDDFTVYAPDNTFELYQNSDWANVTQNLERGDSLSNHTVNFNTNGGQSVNSINTVYIDTEIIPQREGYVFGGWYFSSNMSGQRAEFPMPVRERVNLYAKWYTQLNGTEGLRFSLQSQTDTYAVIGYRGSSSSVTVPTNHNGKLVTAIGTGAFEEITHITEITLPETIKEIKNYAFAGNYNNIMKLSRLNFNGDMLETIGNYAFSYCNNLESITLPPKLKSIGTRAFNNCVSLKFISIPQNVETIENYVFSSCSQLASVSVNPLNTEYRSEEGILYDKNQTTLLYYPQAKSNESFNMPNSVVTIKSGAFGGATHLKEITLSQSLEDIETTAFHFSGIEEIIIPESMISINPSVFRNTPLKDITIGENIVEIVDMFHDIYGLENIDVNEQNNTFKSEDGVLYSNDKKTLLRYPLAKKGTFTMPSGVEEIAPRAFSYSEVEKIVMNEGLKEIGDEAFYQNNNLFQIALPESLEKIGDNAFMNSKNLKGVFLSNPTDYPLLGLNSFAGVNSSITVYAPSEIVDDLQNDTTWNTFDIDQKDRVIDGYHLTFLDEEEGYRIESVIKDEKDLTVPSQIDGVDIVEVGSFAFNATVRRIQLPYTVKTIHSYAFTTNLDSQLSTIVFEQGSLLEEIGQNAFFDCRALTNIVLPSSPPEVIGAATITELAGRVRLITDDISLYENTVFEALSIVSNSDVFGDFVATQKDSQMKITGYLGEDREIIVPDEINSLPVVSVAKNLINPTTIRVVVSAGIKEIEDFAFSSNIYNLDVYETPMAITDIVFENGVETIGKRAFDGLNIKNINIPASVTDISVEAFDGCFSIEEITVDEMNGVYSSFGGALFNKDQTRLIKYAVGSPRLEYIVKDEVEVIGESAFSYANNLISISLNEELEVISRLAFNGCNFLLDLELPEGLLRIEAFAFKDCYRMNNLFVPELVEDISYGAVMDCSEMKAVYVDYSNDNYKSIDGVLFDKSEETLISYPAGKSGEYSIPSTVQNISPYAFYGSNLININIPGSVLQIGEYAFANSMLETITISEGIEQLPQGMLKDCLSLESVSLSEGVRDISAEFAMGANKLRNIDFPDSLETIGERAFYGVSKLNAVQLPDSLSSIGDGAFAGCGGMTQFTMPRILNDLGEGILSGSDSLREITMTTQYALKELFGEIIAEGIPASVKDIYAHPGEGDIPEGFFKGYHKIESIYLPSTLGIIAKEAFMNCSSLIRVEIPSGYEMSSIAERAFYNCSSLEVFEIMKGNPPALHSTAFSGQDGEPENLKIYVPSGESYDSYSEADTWQNLEIVAI